MYPSSPAIHHCRCLVVFREGCEKEGLERGEGERERERQTKGCTSSLLHFHRVFIPALPYFPLLPDTSPKHRGPFSAILPEMRACRRPGELCRITETGSLLRGRLFTGKQVAGRSRRRRRRRHRRHRREHDKTRERSWKARR